MATDNASETTQGVGAPGAGSGMKLYRVAVDEFLKMIDAGIFPREKGDFELLGGLFVVKETAQLHPNRCLVRPDFKLYRVSVKQYLRMLDAGVFRHGANFELIGGLFVQKMVKNDPHDWSVGALAMPCVGACPWVGSSARRSRWT